MKNFAKKTMSCCYHPSTANLDTKNCEAIMCDKLKTLKPVSQVFQALDIMDWPIGDFSRFFVKGSHKQNN